MSRNVVDIFSVPLCIETQVYDMSQEELNYLKSLDTRETPNNKISQDIFVGNNNKLSKLMNIIDYYVENYKSEVLQIDNEIYRTQSWLAVSKKGQSHHEHEHPNTFISAVFYVNCNSGDLVLKRPRSVLQDGFNFSYKIKKFTPANCRKWSVPLKTGDLAIFPAWITHFTYENEDDNDRIILGVNYFLKGQIGTEKGVDIIRI